MSWRRSSTKEAKAQADLALAAERKHNVVQGMHQMHADFSAPPYGEPFVAPPDNAAGPMPGAPSPDQHPEIVATRHLMDMAQQQANIRKTQAQTAAELAKARHASLQGKADVLHTLVQANRLAQTPLPQPGQPGGA